MGKVVKKPSKRDKPGSKPRNDGASRVRKHRAKMKALGLKPVTLWLPDTSTPEYQEKIRRACEAINNHPEERRILAEIETGADLTGWTWDD